jgi:hypothetical protein
MIDRSHDLPIRRQAELVNISRGSAYYILRMRCFGPRNDGPACEMSANFHTEAVHRSACSVRLVS